MIPAENFFFSEIQKNVCYYNIAKYSIVNDGKRVRALSRRPVHDDDDDDGATVGRCTTETIIYKSVEHARGCNVTRMIDTKK